MSKDVVIVYRCDHCKNETKEEDIHADVPWSVGGQAFESDWCPSCLHDITDLLAPWMAEARPARALPKAKPKAKAPAQPRGQGSNNYPDRRFNPEVYELIFGTESPIPGTVILDCPKCDVTYTSTAQTRKNSVGRLRTHLKYVHGINANAYIEDWLTAHPEVKLESKLGGWVIDRG